MIVMKFGGTSVGSIEAITQVRQIVAKSVAAQTKRTGHNNRILPTNRTGQKNGKHPGVVVITSAMSGVTNTVIEAAHKAVQGDITFCSAAQTDLFNKHQAVLNHFVTDPAEQRAVSEILDKRLQEFSNLCQSVATLGELSDRSLDLVSGLGERLSAPLLAAILRAHDIPCEFIDASELVITDSVHGNAQPLMEITERHCQQRLAPLLAEGVVPMITGFVGATIEGIPTTLGRGGSDYSAAIIGAALDADEIQIWTDVDGILTADPRIVPNARTLAQLSYEEVAELAYYGAKVLHPKTVAPALQKQIPVRVLNTFHADHPGTRIVAQNGCGGHGTVKAITAIGNLTMITVAGRGMLGVPGIAARTFGSVARAQANVLMISQASSEQSICFVVPNPSAKPILAALQEEFSREIERGTIHQVLGQPGIAIVAVVGSGLRGCNGSAAKIFQALSQETIPAIAVAQGSSEANVSLVVAEEKASQAVVAIHRIFELERFS